MIRAAVLAVVEGVPAVYTDPGQDTDPAILATAWQRVEAWIGHRWGERSIAIVAEGPGLFESPVQPFVLGGAEEWVDDAWSDTSLTAAPLGYQLPPGTFRLSGTAGTTDAPPAAVLAAVGRLAAYLAWSEKHVADGAPMETSTRLDVLTVDKKFGANDAGKSLIRSGAADLLRPYRRLGVH